MRFARLAPAVLVMVLALSVAVPAAHATAARALVDPVIGDETAAQQTAHMIDIGRMRARYVRLELNWAVAEPAAGVYDEAYFSRMDGLIDVAAANGVKVVVTFLWVPRWASDSRFWDKPPGSYATGYQPFYPVKDTALDDFRAFCAYASSRFKGEVFAYECWNEPNLWPFFYPQQTTNADQTINADFAIDRYFELLRRCYNGVKKGDPSGIYTGDPDALVIAGATGPIGFDDALRTSPQRFAKALKALGASDYMDAYSHHPYVPGGTRDMWPEAKPQVPSSTVSLSNIDVLLNVFPGKPFYLTEYGYNTAQSAMFSATPVSQTTQADYLRRAYRLASSHSQIKAMFWYLRKDWSPSGKASDVAGVYTGLRTVSDARKRSWFTFAGGNSLSLTAPSSVHYATYAKLSGRLTCSRLATASNPGGLGAKALVVQRLANGSWRTLKTVKTRGDGRYTTWVKLTSHARLRLAWLGVVGSPSRFVDVS